MLKKIVTTIDQLPKWYGLGIILLYSILFAEFFISVNNLTPIDEAFIGFFRTIMRISYGVTILVGFGTWVIMSLLFHLTALLFDGHASFKRFLLASAYPYIFSAYMILMGIFVLNDVQAPAAGADFVTNLINDPTFKRAANLMNYSVVPCYLLIAVQIRYTYQINYLYALLSVAAPTASVWMITEFFKWI